MIWEAGMTNGQNGQELKKLHPHPISRTPKKFRNILLPIIYEKPIVRVGAVHLEMGLWMMEETY
jgi:hypothetical protein